MNDPINWLLYLAGYLSAVGVIFSPDLVVRARAWRERRKANRSEAEGGSTTSEARREDDEGNIRWLRSLAEPSTEEDK